MNMKKILIFLLIIIGLIVLLWNSSNRNDTAPGITIEYPEDSEKITLAGGCFWCIESFLQETSGVIDALSGYAGGSAENATYLEVVKGKTDHRESVQVIYDPSIVTLEEIINVFWGVIDPTDDTGQFSDRGFQYTTAIFYHNEEQKKIAQMSKQELNESGLLSEDIATKIIPFESFFMAEEYHQDYYKKAPELYKRYESGSGRKGFIEENWAKDAAIEYFKSR